MRWNFRDSVIYDFDLSVKKELSPPSGTPSINRWITFSRRQRVIKFLPCL